MKKLVLAAALFMTVGSMASFAGNTVMNQPGIESVATVNEFEPIEVKDLPQAVQDAIKKDFAEFVIKEAAVEAAEDGTKTYKVMLVDAEGAETAVLFNENGEQVKPAE